MLQHCSNLLCRCTKMLQHCNTIVSAHCEVISSISNLVLKCLVQHWSMLLQQWGISLQCRRILLRRWRTLLQYWSILVQLSVLTYKATCHSIVSLSAHCNVAGVGYCLSLQFAYLCPVRSGVGVGRPSYDKSCLTTQIGQPLVVQLVADQNECDCKIFCEGHGHRWSLVVGNFCGRRWRQPVLPSVWLGRNGNTPISSPNYGIHLWHAIWNSGYDMPYNK